MAAFNNLALLPFVLYLACVCGYMPIAFPVRSLRLLAASSSDVEVVTREMVAASTEQEKLAVEAIFSSLAGSETFKSVYWQKKPFLCTKSLQNIAGAYTMSDVKEAVDFDFIEAGRGTVLPGKGGWNMASVSQPRGSSFEDAKLRFDDVQMAMKQTSGTVVFNSAGGFIPPLAGVCLQTVSAFDLPAAINMYLTNPGQKLSAPPHTDRQEVFVLQTQGQKRWRVFAPPAPNAREKADPFARGKGKDELTLDEMESPLLDVVLSPGQVLYVPAGFPHTTDTLEGITSPDPSVHLTVGLDSHVWGLTYASLRSYTLRRKGIEDKLLPLTKINAELYWELQQALPLGFLSEAIVEPFKGYGTGMRDALANEVTAVLLQKMRKVEPETYPSSLSDDQMEAQLGIKEATAKIIQHHNIITDILKKMYADVTFKMTPVKMDLSFFRSQPYFQALESQMESLETWASDKGRNADLKNAKGFSGKQGSGQPNTPKEGSSGGSKGFGAKR